MATLTNSYPSLIEKWKATAPGTVLELLRQNNPILLDAIAIECNMDAIHRHMIRTGLPTPTWGRLYKGVQASKSTLQQVDETTGYIQTRSEIAEDLLKLASDPARARLVDTAQYLEALNQEMAAAIFYYDTDTRPETIKGLGARYDTYSTAPVDPKQPNIANQVIHGGGSGSDNTSVWFVTWGEHATHMLYPKGMKGGIDVKDRGIEAVRAADGGTYYAKVTTFDWHVGMGVKDFRYNARIANIDVSELRAGTVDVWKLMLQAYYRLYQIYGIGALGGRTVCYMNREVLEALDRQSTDRALVQSGGNYNYSAPGLSQAQVEGEVVRTYRGIPVRMCDAILNTEAAVPSA